MSVRKRSWTTRGKMDLETGERGPGELREAWIVDYTDQRGERHIETFDRKKDADTRHAEVRVDVRRGVHPREAREGEARDRVAGQNDNAAGWIRLHFIAWR